MTKIEWCDEVWNPITGCSPVSDACYNCYARRMANRLKGRFGYPSDEPFRVTYHPDKLNRPFDWVNPKRIFVCSMGDLFHEDVPIDRINSVFLTILNADWHTYILLTKRPDRMADFMSIGEWRSMMGHVWIGVTAENQRTADERIPILLQISAAVRFVSVEPMLGPIDLRKIKIGWVICGAETGPGARPMVSEWAIDLHKQCGLAGVPFFFKKDSNKLPVPDYVKNTREFPKTATAEPNNELDHKKAKPDE